MTIEHGKTSSDERRPTLETCLTADKGSSSSDQLYDKDGSGKRAAEETDAPE